MFVAPEDGNFRLSPVSPCIDKATPAMATEEGVNAEVSATKVVSNTLEKVLSTLDEKDIETSKNVLRTILLNCGKEDVK